jgi:hypothetical protein
MVDWAEIENVDLIIRPYNWVIHTKNQPDKSGRKAYLQTIYITIFEDDLEIKYKDVPLVGTDDIENMIEEYE